MSTKSFDSNRTPGLTIFFFWSQYVDGYLSIDMIVRKALFAYMTNKDKDITLSVLIPVRVGVPQCAVLGPLLFIIFVNGISTCLRMSQVNTFVDDTIHCNAMHKVLLQHTVRMKGRCHLWPVVHVSNISTAHNHNTITLNIDIHVSGVPLCPREVK